MDFDDTKKLLDIRNNIKDEAISLNTANNILKTHTPIAEEKIVEDKNMLNFLTNKMKEMETEYDQIQHLVIDLGHAYTKIGFSGEDLPTYIMPSIYSDLRNELIDKKSELSFEIK